MNINQNALFTYRRAGIYLFDSFFTMFRNDKITPYTNFASSSNGNADIEVDMFCAGSSSPTATTIPEDDCSVLRGLPYDVAFIEISPGCRYAIARETAGRMASFGAGLGRFVRCQSW